MRFQKMPAYLVLLPLALGLAIPALTGCGGSGDESGGSGGGTYYNGPMKSRSERQNEKPGGGAGSATAPAKGNGSQ
jgi:hypothetical protein